MTGVGRPSVLSGRAGSGPVPVSRRRTTCGSGRRSAPGAARRCCRSSGCGAAGAAASTRRSSRSSTPRRSGSATTAGRSCATSRGRGWSTPEGEPIRPGGREVGWWRPVVDEDGTGRPTRSRRCSAPRPGSWSCTSARSPGCSWRCPPTPSLRTVDGQGGHGRSAPVRHRRPGPALRPGHGRGRPAARPLAPGRPARPGGRLRSVSPARGRCRSARVIGFASVGGFASARRWSRRRAAVRRLVEARRGAFAIRSARVGPVRPDLLRRQGGLGLGPVEHPFPAVLHRLDEATADADDDDAGDRGEHGDQHRHGDRGGDADLVERGDRRRAASTSTWAVVASARP